MLKNYWHVLAVAILVFLLGSVGPVPASPNLTPEQLAALTPLAPGAVPRSGTFWLLKGPYPNSRRPYPPLPCPPGDLDVPIYALGDDQFLCDDSAVDWDAVFARQALEVELSASSAADATSPRFMDSSSYSSEDLWLEFAGVTNATGAFVIHPPAAEQTSGVYDVFLTTNLTTSVAGLNLTNWTWLVRRFTNGRVTQKTGMPVCSGRMGSCQRASPLKPVQRTPSPFRKVCWRAGWIRPGC
jgi:hypothetical protein